MDRRSFLKYCAGALAAAAIPVAIAAQPAAIIPAPPLPNQGDAIPDPGPPLIREFIGKSYELKSETMYVKRETFLLEFFAYETVGATLTGTACL